VSDRNKAVSRAVFEIWSSGELDRLGDYVADDVVHHDPYDPHGADGIEGHKKTIAMNREAFPTSRSRLTIRSRRATGSRPGGPAP
jgi:ketosteroid isomerase-like protein